MENSNYKLQKIEAISIIVIIMLNKLILNVPYIVISTVGTGIIVNLIYIGIVDLLFSILLVKLFEKFQNADIIDISEYLGGKFLKWENSLYVYNENGEFSDEINRIYGRIPDGKQY